MDAKSRDDFTPSLFEMVFLILFAQLFALVLCSFVFQQGPVFVERIFFGFDYKFFYAGVGDWFCGIDPYTVDRRLVTPPFSLCAGALFHWVRFERARDLFFILNTGLIAWSLLSYARQVGLNCRAKLMLILIASVYYPAYFLIERGNLDGIMLALLVLAFTAQHWLARAILLGASVAIKLYSGTFLVVFSYRRKWGLLLATVLAAAFFQLPFAGFLGSFIHAVLSRSTVNSLKENISPGAWIYLVSGRPHVPGATAVLLVFWALTLLWMLTRARNEETPGGWALYVPWMIAFPTVVYPYTGVLLLVLLAFVVQKVDGASLRVSDSLLLVGFLLSGTHAVAWTHALEPLTRFSRAFHLLNPTGTVLLILGACLWVPPAVLFPPKVRSAEIVDAGQGREQQAGTGACCGR